VLTTNHIELEVPVSLPDLNPTALIDLEQLAVDVQEAVLWACLRYQGHVRRDELDDFSQQIILKLFEDDCRRLRSFDYSFSFKTWLQRVVDHDVYRWLYRRKRAESFDDVDQMALVYSPPQDRDIYASEQRKMISRAIGALSEQERLLYNLWFVSELAPIKIAAVFRTEVRIIYKRKQTLVLKLTRLVHRFQSR
jgi:RNA polymerase sigma factor (sigma-70 family)